MLPGRERPSANPAVLRHHDVLSRDLLRTKRRQWFCIPNELKIGIACRACIREKRWRELKAHCPFGLVRRDVSRLGGDEQSEHGLVTQFMNLTFWRSFEWGHFTVRIGFQDSCVFLLQCDCRKTRLTELGPELRVVAVGLPMPTPAPARFY